MGLLIAIVRAVVWVLAVLFIGLGVAGVSQAVNPVPDESSRPELYAAAEREIAPAMSRLVTELDALDVPVEALAAAARAALVDLTARDTASVARDLASGEDLVAQIGTHALSVRAALDALPYDESSDRILQATRVRIAAARQAFDDVKALADLWARLEAATAPTTDLVTALTAHDQATFEAIGEGAAGHYAAALGDLATASAQLDTAQGIRDRVAKLVDTSTIDQWIQRNRGYDAALVRLYKDLRASRGKATAALRKELAAVDKARQLLPPDTRALVVIVGDLAKGGLNDTAIAIELARGALADAIAAVH
ncbi:MAG: hypothetical protein ACHQ15_00295 [Candidatus Limnocylindrales bacterium]